MKKAFLWDAISAPQAVVLPSFRWPPSALAAPQTRPIPHTPCTQHAAYSFLTPRRVQRKKKKSCSVFQKVMPKAMFPILNMAKIGLPWWLRW